MTQPRPAAPPHGLTPQKLHHSAYVTQDSAATVDFYTRIMGLPFCSTVMDDRVPSTGQPFPYFHLFFRMPDDSTIAFFESPVMPAPAAASHPAYDVFNHLALEAGSTENVDRWAAWLKANGIEVVGPTNHGIIYSIYFHDPNGIRLELTTTTQPVWLTMEEQAWTDLEQWEGAKRTARAQGRDVGEALVELINSNRFSQKHGTRP